MAKDNIVWDDAPSGGDIVWDDAAPAKKLTKSLSRQAIDAFQPQNVVKAGYGALETATQMATGIPAQIAGGLRGIASLVSGEGVDEATRKIRGTEEAMTFQPRTQAGQTLSRTVGEGMEAVNKGVGKVGQFVGGDVGEAIGEVAVPIAGTVLGGGSVLRAARGKTVSDVAAAGRELVSDAAETPQFLKKARERAPTKDQVEQSMRTADTIDITNRGMDLGLKVDPAVTAPTRLNRALRQVAGPEDLNEALTTANRAKATEVVKRDLGIAPNAEINTDTITAMRNQADLPNQHIRNLGQQVSVDAPTVGEIQRLKIERPIVGEEAAAGAVNRLVDSMSERINSGSMTAPEIMEHVRVFRENARDIRSKNELTTADRQLASANRSLADALEGSVERNLTKLAEENPTHGYDRLLADFQKGRSDMARSYLLEDVLDKTTGQLDFKKLAKEVADNPAVSGELKTVGEFAGRYPEVFSAVERPGRSALEKHVITRTTIPGAVVGMTLGGTPMGIAAGALANKALSSGARRMLTSDRLQQGGRMVDYRPAELRGGPSQPLLREDVPAPGPRPFGRLTLADDAPLPTSRANIDPQVRSTLELAPMDEQAAATQALRGAKTRLGSQDYPTQAPNPAQAAMLQQRPTPGQAGGPVEMTPGGGMNMPLPIEKASGALPPYFELIEKYRKQAENAPTRMEREMALEQLRNVEAMIPDVMAQEGLSSPTQLLYGEGAGYPIAKGFDARPEQFGPFLSGALRNRSK